MISVIIPNFNGRDHLAGLMPTLDAQTYREFEVVLVDNASVDDSVQSAKSARPDMRIVQLAQNYGFAYACNRGAEIARGELLFFLNSDTQLDPFCLERLKRSADEFAGAGFFQPKLINMDKRDILDGAGDYLPPDGRPQSRAAGKSASIPLDADIVSPRGAASLWRKNIFAELGGFEESFFAYLEDVDLGLRACLQGIRGKYVENAAVYHKGAGAAQTLGRSGKAVDRPEAVRWISRNKIWLWTRCLPAGAILLNAPSMAIGFARSSIYHTFLSGSAAAYWRGVAEAIAGMPQAMRARKKIQRSKKIETKEFIEWTRRT